MGKKKLSKSIEERRKKKSHEIPLVSRNRFEVHINRSKHNILGKKDKNDRGIPGISRSKANKKRKQTLLVKYKQRNKSNVMIDKRFGEFDETVTAEEKMLKRFTLEKQSHHVKTGHYNIEDDEELTHYGQSLGEISNFNEIEFGSSGDEYGESSGGLLTKKKKISENREDPKEYKKLSKQEIMQEIIVDSKRDKHERQKTKELAFELTQKLDTEWKEIHSMLTKRSDSKTKTNVPKEKQDDYDKIVNELIFEAKGKPTERLKSVEEISREEKQKQAKLEKQRVDRMQMVDEDEDGGSIHQSADALIEKMPKKVDDRYLLHYRDGKMVKPEGFDESLILGGDKLETANVEEEDDGDDSEEEGTDEDNAGTDNEDVFSDEERSADCCNSDSKEHEPIKEDAIRIEVDEKECETLKNDDKSEVITDSSKITTKKSKKSRKKKSDVNDDKCLYDFHVPENLESLLSVIQSTKLEISVLLPKIRQTNTSNKKKLEKLFDISLEYIEHICSQPEPSMQCINKLGGFIQQLVQDVPVYITKAIQEKLKTLLRRICTCIKQKHYSEILPSLSELTVFKIIELIFPTSDLNHVITTPCLFIIALIFMKARFTTIKCILSGIFLLDVVYNYVKLSKRYLPELVTFLVRLFYQAVPANLPLKKITSSILNMQKNECGMLYISDKEDVQLHSINIMVLSSCEVTSLENDSTRLSIIRNMLLLTEKFCNLYNNMETYTEIFEPVSSLLEMLPVKNYPSSMMDLCSNLLELMQSKSAEKTPLKLQTRKPIPLTLLEPQFEEVNENVFKKRTGDKARNEHDKLKYKVKKELKGALREIRKDSHYLAKQQLGEKMEKDATRKRKVKELQSSLENERREIKEMEKGSKFKK